MARERGYRNQSAGPAGPCVSLIAPPEAKHIVVTGGRGYDNPEAVCASLDAVLAKFGSIQIAEGGCPTGADAIARVWARSRKVICTTFRADWDNLGRKAGPWRTQKMIDEFKPIGVVAFPGGAGTLHCVRCANRAGIPVWHPLARKPRRSSQEEQRPTM
jgi:hypothetical protein